MAKAEATGNERREMATGEKLEQFAEDVGRLLGTARAKAESWLGQREEIVKSLEGIRDVASQLLTQLGHEAAAAVGRGRGGRRAKSKTRGRRKSGGRRVRGWTAEQRAEVAARMKRYWASRRKNK